MALVAVALVAVALVAVALVAVARLCGATGSCRAHLAARHSHYTPPRCTRLALSLSASRWRYERRGSVRDEVRDECQK